MTSEAFRRSAFAQQTEEAIIPLITITHPSMPGPLRFANNGVNVTSRGEEYLAYPFEIDLPTQDPERAPRSPLRIDNVDRQIVEELRLLTGPPTVTLELVLADDPDTVESGPYPFSLTNASYDIATVEGELAFQDTLNRKFPKSIFTPQSHPGLF